MGNKKIRLNAREALAISEEAIKNKSKTKTADTEQVYELTNKERDFQFDFIHTGIEEAAKAGKLEFSILYNTVNEKTGKPVFSMEFFEAISHKFKEAFPHYMVIMDRGPLRKLTIKWSGKYEV